MATALGLGALLEAFPLSLHFLKFVGVGIFIFLVSRLHAYLPKVEPMQPLHWMTNR